MVPTATAKDSQDGSKRKSDLKLWRQRRETFTRSEGSWRLVILRVGPLNPDITNDLKKRLHVAFPRIIPVPLEGHMETPDNAYNSRRRQFRSGFILGKIFQHTERSIVDRVLGITDLDLYAPGLNFVFGAAECPGRTAIISLHRLKPEFYGQQPNYTLFIQRSIKEAIHETGHMLGLRHCRDPLCVMFFSSSILDTDQKKSTFCERCYPLIEKCLSEVQPK